MERTRKHRKCVMSSCKVANYARRFLLGRWSFLGPGSEKKWYGTYSDKPDGDWDRTAEQMILTFAGTSHPIFRAWVRGWILGNTKIGPVLDVKVCFHQGRFGTEVMIQSLFRDRTVSWVRVVNGIDKYVTETSETSSLESVKHSVTGKPGAKARPQPTPAVTLSPISIPVRERNWIDINPERFREDCFTVSKSMIRFLRHDPSIPREDDGAVRFGDIVEEFKAKFVGTFAMVSWYVDYFSGKMRRTKEKFPLLLEPWLFQTLPVFESNSGIFRR